MEPVDRLRQQVDALTSDFHRVVSALTSLHSRNEEDIDELKQQLKNLERALHELDKQVVALSTRYEMIQPPRGDLTPMGVPLHQHQHTSPTQPKPDRTSSPEFGTWLLQTKAIASKWGPLFLSLLMFLLATLQHCGIIGVRETPTSTVITVPGRLRAPAPESQTNSAPR